MIGRFWSQLTHSDGLVAMGVLSLGNIGGTLISALALIIFSRILGPAEFGIFSALFALMQIMVRLTDFGLTAALDRTVAGAYQSHPARARRAMLVALYLKAALATLVLGGALLVAPVIAERLKLDNLLLIRLAIILSLATGLFEYVAVLFQSTHQFGSVAKLTIAQATGKLILGVVAIVTGSLTAGSALLIYGCMPGAAALMFLKKSPLPIEKKLPTSWQGTAQTLGKVAIWTGLAALAATVADNVDTLLVQSYLSAHDTGLWAAASRIASFAFLIPWSVGVVLNVRVARYRDPSHLRAYLHKAHLAAIGSFLLILVGIPLSGLGIWVTAGNAYLAATPALELMLLAAALAAATAPYASLFYVLDYPVYYALAGIIGSVALIGLDFVGIPWGGLIGAGLARVAARAAVLIFTLCFAAYGIHRQFHKST